MAPTSFICWWGGGTFSLDVFKVKKSKVLYSTTLLMICKIHLVKSDNCDKKKAKSICSELDGKLEYVVNGTS